LPDKVAQKEKSKRAIKPFADAYFTVKLIRKLNSKKVILLVNLLTKSYVN
jgi:hypothetical protein